MLEGRAQKRGACAVAGGDDRCGVARLARTRREADLAQYAQEAREPPRNEARHRVLALGRGGEGLRAHATFPKRREVTSLVMRALSSRVFNRHIKV